MSIHSIRGLTDSDWLEYKTIRLRSLQDSPDSFGSTYEREAVFQVEQWQARLKGSASVRDAVTLAAFSGDSCVGLLSCVISDDVTRRAQLYQMWVAPENRRKGVGISLVNHAKQWAYKRNIRTLVLSVTTVNAEAISLYKSNGFVPTGETEPLRQGSSLESQTMEAKLNANDS